MNIRSEAPADYPAIAEIHARAFGFRATEAAIVMMYRQRRRFDAALSLVAEIDGQIVGHALFSPQTLRILGQDVEAVNLAPIGVHNLYQRQGIGTALIEEGHRIARAKGYVLSFLLGHPSYYPRFGYQTHAYGSSTVTARTAELSSSPLETRSPSIADVEVLQSLWQHEEHGVDFAMDPGPDFLEWVSPNSAHEVRVYLRDGEIIGYTRCNNHHVLHFLAANPEAAHSIAGMLATGLHEIVLPLHPFSASAAVFSPPKAVAWEAGMALSLQPNPFDEYYTLVQKGARPPGRVIWPVAFDL